MSIDMSASGGNRMVPIDVLKGLLMIGIVLLHIFMLNSTERGGDLPVAFSMLYLGLLSFYVIAGYFYKPGRTFKDNMRRVLRLVIALVVTSIALPVLIFIWFAITGQTVTLSDLGDSILRAFWLYRLFEPMDGPLGIQMCFVNFINYFLWPMAEGLIIFFALEKHVMSDKRKIIAVIIITLLLQVVTATLFIKLPFYLQLCPIATALIFLGAFLSQYRVFDRIGSFDWKNPRYWAVFIVSLLTAYVLCTVFPGGVKFDYMYFGEFGPWSVFIYVIEAFFVTIFYVYLGTMLSKIPFLSSILSISGRHSLGLALYHVFIAKMIMAPFYIFTFDTWFPEDIGMSALIIIAVADVILCVIISEFGGRLLSGTIVGSREEKSDA